MGGAEDRRDEARRAKARLGGSDNRGTYTYTTSGRGKNRERRKVYTPHKIEKYKGTKGFDYKGTLAKKDKFVAGANVFDKKTGKVGKREGFSDYLKGTGNRADDPRNWEFHYKAPSQAFSTRGKDDHRVDNRAQARRVAEKTARRTGKSVYDVQKIEYETEGIKQGTRASGLKAKAMGGAGAFGSTRVATGVAAQRQKASRRTGRAAARGPTTGAIA
jgi:hypothetical protein